VHASVYQSHLIPENELFIVPIDAGLLSWSALLAQPLSLAYLLLLYSRFNHEKG
jgi:hypothetical protein